MCMHVHMLVISPELSTYTCTGTICRRTHDVSCSRNFLEFVCGNCTLARVPLLARPTRRALIVGVVAMVNRYHECFVCSMGMHSRMRCKDNNYNPTERRSREPRRASATLSPKAREASGSQPSRTTRNMICHMDSTSTHGHRPFPKSQTSTGAGWQESNVCFSNSALVVGCRH